MHATCSGGSKNMSVTFEQDLKKGHVKKFIFGENKTIYFKCTMKSFVVFLKIFVYVLQKQSPQGVLKNVALFKRKHSCQSLFFNKVLGWKSTTLFKKDGSTDVFL